MSLFAPVLRFSNPPSEYNPLTGGTGGAKHQKADCESCLHGVSDALDFIATAAPAAGLMEKCVPDGITTGKLCSVITKMPHRKGIHRLP
ncbi:MAG: hypothetical protein ACXWLT_00430 [Rhizomicrobium sp.]